MDSGVPVQNRGADQEENFSLNETFSLLRDHRITLKNKRNNDIPRFLSAVDKITTEPVVNKNPAFADNCITRTGLWYYRYLSLLYLY